MIYLGISLIVIVCIVLATLNANSRKPDGK